MAKKQPVATPKAKDKTKVKNDPLADLGLDELPADKIVAGVEAGIAAGAADTATADASNEEVDVGDIEIGVSDFIPSAKRMSGGSKYPFDKLTAPTKDAATGKSAYSNFMVKLQAGVDEDKLKRSVQSATTQANRQGADEGKYFVSRSITKDGKFVGMAVYRTDVRPAKGEAE